MNIAFVFGDYALHRTDAIAAIAIESEPHVIFSHEDDALGPAGTDEWHAFIHDSEGNLVGLVSHEVHA